MNEKTVNAVTAFIATYNEIHEKAILRECEWVEDLKSKGFKGAHPNDGWVDLEKQELIFMNPQFNDGVTIGDLVAIGRPDEDIIKIRLLEVSSRLIDIWKFKIFDN